MEDRSSTGGKASLPGAQINRHNRGGDHCDQDGIRQVTRAWHAGILSWKGAHASIPHMLTTTCLSQGMPWMPPGRGILGDNIASPALLAPHYQATFPSKAVDIGRYLPAVVIRALSARVNLLPGPYSSYSVNSWPEYPSYSWPPPN